MGPNRLQNYSRHLCQTRDPVFQLQTRLARSALYSLHSTVYSLQATGYNLQQSSLPAGLFPLETRQTIGDSHCHFWPVFSTLAKSAKCTKLATGLESRWGGYCCCFCNCSYCRRIERKSNDSQYTQPTDTISIQVG